MSLCDKVVCYDNSSSEPVLFFKQDENGQTVLNNEILGQILRFANDN